MPPLHRVCLPRTIRLLASWEASQWENHLDHVHTGVTPSCLGMRALPPIFRRFRSHTSQPINLTQQLGSGLVRVGRDGVIRPATQAVPQQALGQGQIAIGLSQTRQVKRRVVVAALKRQLQVSAMGLGVAQVAVQQRQVVGRNVLSINRQRAVIPVPCLRQITPHPVRVKAQRQLPSTASPGARPP